MRFSKYYLSIAPLAAWLSVGTACQSARPATFLPQAQATAPALTAKAAPSPAAPAVEVETSTIKPEVHVAPKTDPVADLLAQIEKEYQAGQVNFKAGRLDAAKQNYDHALDMLAKSGLRAFLAPGYASARWKLENDFELTGPTSHQVRTAYAAHADRMPLILQEHGGSVQFRNIWLVLIDE